MIFKPYYYFETGCAAYLFGCGSLAKCAVVDAHEHDVDTYVSFATSKGMHITHVIDTHVHADHRSGGPALAKKVGAPYCLHESADVAFPFEPLRDGQELELGNTRIRVLHTPGHTPESVCLVVSDLRRGTDPWFVLTGDTLFVGAVGRPDLPGRARENASELYDSVHQKLLTLPGELEIFPGHFAGSAWPIAAAVAVVPAVTTRTIARLTTDLEPRLRASAGLSVCSAMATRWPALISRAR